MKIERFWEDIETGYIYDNENNDFEPVKTLNEQSNKINELKQQLAEKDKEIERLKTQKNQQSAERKKIIKEKNEKISELSSDLNFYVSELNKALDTIRELRNEKEEPKLRMELLQRRHQQDVEDKRILTEQLAEKDKEIEKLHKYLELDWAMTPQRVDGKTWTKIEIIREWEKEILHQVCDEIKREIANLENIELSSYVALCDIIDKIEKGEIEC